MSRTIRVIKPGLETTVQDWPGLKGAFRYGFNHSGAIDHWTFRLANLLVGNKPGAPGLEAQFIGPTLLFESDQLFALTGANMQATLDGKSIPCWQTLEASAGQRLALGSAISGARTYIAFSGGIIAKPFLGSCSTHTMAQAGGINGRKLEINDEINIHSSTQTQKFTTPELIRPPKAKEKYWEIEMVVGPCDDWISDQGHQLFINSEWIVSPRSNRMGVRLEGPPLDFSSRATDKAPEHGSHPSNCVDIGYPVGGINLCGDTPVVLLHEGLTGGGFIVPFTVPSSEFSKVGQARPHEIFKFKAVSVQQSQSKRHEINEICQTKNLRKLGD